MKFWFRPFCLGLYGTFTATPVLPKVDWERGACWWFRLRWLRWGVIISRY